MHQVSGGKPIHLAGKPRGQLVQIGGKGQQQLGLIQAQQGALSTISLIPQGGAGGVLTLGQPRTPTAGKYTFDLDLQSHVFLTCILY